MTNPLVFKFVTPQYLKKHGKFIKSMEDNNANNANNNDNPAKSKIVTITEPKIKIIILFFAVSNTLNSLIIFFIFKFELKSIIYVNLFIFIKQNNGK